jgi:hypothetical protein
MVQEPSPLDGRWKRLTTFPPLDFEKTTFGHDASQFPAELELRGSRYRGTKGEDQSFIVWDVGTFTVGDAELIISLANDTLERYPLEIGDNTFTVADASGRRTTYERID